MKVFKVVFVMAASSVGILAFLMLVFFLSGAEWSEPAAGAVISSILGSCIGFVWGIVNYVE